ncbi:MAG: hypothetical protein ABJF10_23820 [Chthoniobacter sp.]|uniref:hypothetical protein n=1 Tax=Chthoniobacter sp. TaxID=2510640 RepID=UPI0032A5BFF8
MGPTKRPAFGLLCKIVGMVVLATVLGGVAVVGGIEFLRWRSERQVTAIVSELVPGAPFSAAVARLGPPTQTITDPVEMRAFNRPIPQPVVPDSTLNLFVHRGPPFRWILVYTDKAGQRIQHAEWQNM